MEGIDIQNRYSLLGREDKARAQSVERAELELNELVQNIASSYDEIKKKHPRIGIGDTATDEAIVRQIYHALH